MALTKYASLEGAEVLEVKSSPTRVKTASLDKMSDFHDYRTEDGYLYVRIRAISSRVNKNNDGWPTAELAGGAEAWEKISSRHEASEGGFTITSADTEAEHGFPTFLHKPHFIDHHNSNPERARGVVVDSKFNVLDSKTAAENDDYWGGRSGHIDPEHLPAAEVELLIEVDAKTFPKYAEAIVKGDIDGFSMGCDVDYSKCSHCGHEASSPDEYCSHIVMKGADMTVESGDHRGKTAKTYENCYGIKFFEISGVFDPADETALAKEVRAAVYKEAEGLQPTPYHKPEPEEVMQLARRIVVDNPGMGLGEAMQMAAQELTNSFDGPVQGGDGAYSEDPKRTEYTPLPNEIPTGGVGITPRYQGSYLAAKQSGVLKEAQPKEPQSMHTKAPNEVDTLREEKICPQCGSDMDDVKCVVCGFEEPPESLQNPDLEKAQMNDEAADPTQDPTADPTANPAAPTQGDSYLQTRNPQPTASVKGEMRWNPKGIDLPKTAAEKPSGDEPIETVTSDQTTPVTSALRTAQELIQAAKRNQENNMSDQTKVAADPADASGKPDKRVDVEGVGGVIQDTNEEASKPRGPHSWEPKGTTTDVEGKGGIIEDSNAEASEPSAGTQDVEKAVDTADSGPTKTWDNSNEPNSAVTDKAVQAAKGGTKPIGGADVQPQRREDLEQESGFSNPQDGTDQWTGTGGNGVTKQQDPVTQKVDPNIEQRSSGFVSVAALKLAEAEIELGITPSQKKFDRLAELRDLDETEILAEHRALAKVKTAGLTRTASRGGTSRMPSFGRIARDVKESEAQPVDDALLDSAVFGR